MRKLGFFSARSGPVGNPLFVGIAVGILIGLCLSLLDDAQMDDYLAMLRTAELPDAFFAKLPFHLGRKMDKKEQSNGFGGGQPPPWLRCLVLLESGDGLKPEKQFAATRDTWARDCNETFYFTDSRVLHRRYSEEMPKDSSLLLLVPANSSPSPNEWKIVRNVLSFVGELKASRNGEKWTVLSDGKSHVHTRNLRDLLSTVEEGIPIILGRREQLRPSSSPLGSFLANLLPSSSSALDSSSKYPLGSTISTDAPIVLSQRAFHVINRNCNSRPTRRWWLPFDGPLFGTSPRHSGRAIGGCALQLGVALWDPVDEESRPLIVAENLRTLFSKEVADKNATRNGEELSIADSARMAKCCSDRTIAFGLLNHKDQRLIDFGVRQLKVFGSVRR